MADELQMIEAMSVLQLQPGDTLILKTDAHMSTEMAARLIEAVRDLVGDWPVMVLDQGMDIGVLRGAAKAE